MDGVCCYDDPLWLKEGGLLTRYPMIVFIIATNLELMLLLMLLLNAFLCFFLLKCRSEDCKIASK